MLIKSRVVSTKKVIMKRRRIKIKDLPKDIEISKEEMKKTMGSGFLSSAYRGIPTPALYPARFSLGETFSAGTPGVEPEPWKVRY